MTQAVANRNQNEIEQANEGVNAISRRFLSDVEKQFQAELGAGPKFSEFEKRLTQHMYLKVDAALKFAETKRKGGKEFSWFTIDRQKLAIDTVHRVSLGLDALIPNHIHPVCYWNSHKEVYDVDLQVGYMGRDFIARRHAVHPPLDIIYELVYDSDHFKALPRSSSREVEGYEFEIENPFDRGAIIGGFGYVIYDDERKNRLVLVTQRDFNRSKNASKSNFWRDNDVEMHWKTVVHRVASKIPLDSEKVNASALAAVTAGDDGPSTDEQVALEAHGHANQELLELDDGDDRTIDMDTGEVLEEEDEPAQPAPETREPVAAGEQGKIGPGF